MGKPLDEHPLFETVKQALMEWGASQDSLTAHPDDLTKVILASIIGKIKGTEAASTFGWFYDESWKNGD